MVKQGITLIFSPCAYSTYQNNGILVIIIIIVIVLCDPDYYCSMRLVIPL